MRAAEQTAQDDGAAVLIVDPRAVVRDGLVMALRALGHRAFGVAEVQEIDLTDSAPAAVVVDGARAGVHTDDVRRLLASISPSTRLLVVADADERPFTGGVEAVDRSQGADGIARALRDRSVSGGIAERADQTTGCLLSGTERAVLRLIARGATAKEAAAALEISPRTVENRKRRIFDLLGATTQAQAVSLAIQRGELSPLEYAS